MWAKLVGALVVLGLLVAGRALRLAAHDEYTAQRAYEDVYYLPPAHWLPVLSLGFRDAVADVLWSRTLVYFGEELKHGGEVRHVFNYADAMLALDPEFRAVYRWASTAALYRPKDITVDDAQHAVSYLERAVKLWPDDGELAWDLGATLRFELEPLLRGDEQAQREAKLRGSEYIQTAARLGAGPAWLAVTAATGFEEAGRTEVAIRHLEEVYQSLSDPEAKKRVEQRLARLRSESYVQALRQAVSSFEAEKRENYPYLSDGLYLILGPKPERAWAEAVARGFIPEGEDVAELDDEVPSEPVESDAQP